MFTQSAMPAGSGLRTPRAMQSSKVGAPLMEAEVDVDSSDMPPAFSSEPAQVMEELLSPKKPTAPKKRVQKKTNGYENGSQGRSSAAPKTSAPSQHPGTISLGDELLPEDFSRRDSGAGLENQADSITLAAAAAERSIDEDARHLIAKSWQVLKEHEENCKKGQNTNKAEEDNEGNGEGPGSAEGPQAASKKSSGLFSRFSSKKNHEGESSSASKGQDKGKDKNGNNSNAWDIPQTFKEMVFLNAAMTGANMAYIEVVESSFEKMVVATSNGDFVQLEIESSIMALRMSKDVKGNVRLVEFKTCMLASLRSLLPKTWSISHEQAWSKMWEMVETTLTKTLPLPGKYEKAVDQAISDMSEEDKKTYGLNAFNRFFAKQKKAEYHFNTSNARLSVLAMQGLQLCQDIYKEPTRLVNVVTSLGLKHIMYNISTEYFDSFVEAMVEELACWAKNPAAIEGVEWGLTQIAAIMVYTIREGSNPLLQAVITNNAKKVRSALAPLAKKDRAAVALGATSQMVTGTKGAAADDMRK